MGSPDRYLARGVAAGKEDLHHALKHSSPGLFTDTFCKILPFPILEHTYQVLHADTAGSKPTLAYLWYKETGDLHVWKGIVQDALVMNLDDMACSGVLNHFTVSSTLARNTHHIPGEVLSKLIESTTELAQWFHELGITLHLAGGETADVGDVVRTLDVGFTVHGLLKPDQVIHIQPKPGDVMVGVASYGQAKYEDTYNSGIGCNGLTAAKHELLSPCYAQAYPESFDPAIPASLAYCGKFRLQTIEPNTQKTLGELLLSPTRTYLPALKSLIPHFKPQIRGIIHHTGGGYTKPLRFTPHLALQVDHPLPVPPLFKWIQEQQQMPLDQLYRTFNMGQRLSFFTTKEAADDLVDGLKDFGLLAQKIGQVAHRQPGGPAMEIHTETEILRYF